MDDGLFDLSNLPKPVNLIYDKYQQNDNSNNLSPLVILHGITDNRTSWQDFCKKFSEKTNRTAYCVDLRSHGQSPRGELNYKEVISDLKEFFKKEKIEKAICFGHSLGGILFSRYVTLFPKKVEKFIILDVNPGKMGSGETILHTIIIQKLNFLKIVLDELRKENITDLAMANLKFNEKLASLNKNPKLKKNNSNDLLIIRDGQLDFRFDVNSLIKYVSTLDSMDNFDPSFNGNVLLIYGTKSDIFKLEKDEKQVREQFPNVKFEKIDEAIHTLHLNLNHREILLNIVLNYVNS